MEKFIPAAHDSQHLWPPSGGLSISGNLPHPRSLLTDCRHRESERSALPATSEYCDESVKDESTRSAGSEQGNEAGNTVRRTAVHPADPAGKPHRTRRLQLTRPAASGQPVGSAGEEIGETARKTLMSTASKQGGPLDRAGLLSQTPSALMHCLFAADSTS